MKIIHQADYKTNTWKGGITRELYITPREAVFPIVISMSEFHRLSSISLRAISLTSAVINDTSSPWRAVLRFLEMKENTSFRRQSPFSFRAMRPCARRTRSGAIDFNVIFRADQQVEVKVVERAHADNEQTRTLLFAIDEIIVDGQRVGSTTRC